MDKKKLFKIFGIFILVLMVAFLIFWQTVSIENAFEEIEEDEGIIIFNHPGRYDKSADWYNDFYDKYNNTIVGLEVYNQGNRYDDDWLLWDEINKVRAPNDLVWGYSNDDYHRKSHSFRNYQHMLMDDRTEENLKAAMKYGASYFSYEPQGANETLSTYGTAITPKISEISIEEMNITITGTEYDNITWYDESTEAVWQMEEINVSKFESNFVRAILENEHGKTLSQPFGYNADKIFNPYENVDWEVTNHFKANFHTHTTESDGDQTPEEVITKYINANYDILAITDHNKNSWSWTNWINSEPVSPSSTSAYYQGFEILAVSGNEPSNSHHFVSLFSDYSGHAIDLGFLFSEYL